MQVKEHIKAIESELNTRYINRTTEIHGLVLALLAKQHVLYLGPPGVAKTMMVEDFASYLGASYFRQLMHQHITPDDIAGPISISSLKRDERVRVTTNMMPEAQIVYLDEIYKAGGTVLNTLLSILQERVFHNNGVVVKCPLVFCVASSNELPNEDDPLGALHDRWLLKYNTGYLDDGDEFVALMRLGSKPKLVAPLALDGLVDTWTEIGAMSLGMDTIDTLQLVWTRAREEGLIFSDRRYKQLLLLMAAESWLQDKTEIVPESIEIAEHVLWDKIEDKSKIRAIIINSINPVLAQGQSILAAAHEVMSEIGLHSEQGEMIQVSKQLRSLISDLDGLRQTTSIVDITLKVRAMNANIARWNIERLQGVDLSLEKTADVITDTSCKICSCIHDLDGPCKWLCLNCGTDHPKTILSCPNR